MSSNKDDSSESKERKKEQEERSARQINFSTGSLTLYQTSCLAEEL